MLAVITSVKCYWEQHKTSVRWIKYKLNHYNMYYNTSLASDILTPCFNPLCLYIYIVFVFQNVSSVVVFNWWTCRYAHHILDSSHIITALWSLNFVKCGWLLPFVSTRHSPFPFMLALLIALSFFIVPSATRLDTNIVPNWFLVQPATQLDTIECA